MRRDDGAAAVPWVCGALHWKVTQLAAERRTKKRQAAFGTDSRLSMSNPPKRGVAVVDTDQPSVIARRVAFGVQVMEHQQKRHTRLLKRMHLWRKLEQVRAGAESTFFFNPLSATYISSFGAELWICHAAK